ncbi:MAG: ABC transporter permease [Candidatus Omnitrophica bacterium]|nr:ABC transporter permease [Candidatus Omnitrophota bacterium]
MKPRAFLFYPALGAILLLIAAATFADWLAPYSSQEETREHSFHPPSKIYWDFSHVHLLPRPFVYATQMHFDANFRRFYVENQDRKYFIKFSLPSLRASKGRSNLISVDSPARIYLLGTDSRGRDLFSRILYGSRISLSIGFLGASLALAVGLLIGALAGYFGGRLDQLLMRLAEFFIMIPGFYFLLALRSVLPPSLGSQQVYALIVVILSLIGWGGIARVVRGMVFSIRENDFIAQAKILGRSHFEIIFRHVLPHTFSYLIVVMSVSVPGYILGESALSVLGLGIRDPDVSWGNLLTESLSIAHITLHPWVLVPGFLIFAVFFCFHAIGDGLMADQKELGPFNF